VWAIFQLFTTSTELAQLANFVWLMPFFQLFTTTESNEPSLPNFVAQAFHSIPTMFPGKEGAADSGFWPR